VNGQKGLKLVIVGNYPYNISTQIVFRMLEGDQKIHQFAGMFQKEVAKAILRGARKQGIWNHECDVTGVLQLQI